LAAKDWDTVSNKIKRYDCHCQLREQNEVRTAALAACVTAHLVQTVSDDVQSDARIGACISVRTASSPALKVSRLFVVVQWMRTKFGECTFVVAGPVAWNQLLCSISNSSSVNSFKTALKTFLFAS